MQKVIEHWDSSEDTPNLQLLVSTTSTLRSSRRSRVVAPCDALNPKPLTLDHPFYHFIVRRISEAPSPDGPKVLPSLDAGSSHLAHLLRRALLAPRQFQDPIKYDCFIKLPDHFTLGHKGTRDTPFPLHPPNHVSHVRKKVGGRRLSLSLVATSYSIPSSSLSLCHHHLFQQLSALP